MSMYKNLTTICAVAALALGLAACGGGGGSDSTPAASNGDTMQPDPVVAERAAISTAITAAQTAVNAVDNDSTDAEVTAAETAIATARKAISDAANVPAEEKAANTGTVTALETQLSGAKMARMDATDEAEKTEMKAMNAMAKKLYAGLDPEATGAGAALNDATISITAMGLSGDPDGSGSESAVTLKATDTTVMGYGVWKGTDYVKKKTTAPTMTDHAVIYSNRGAPETMPFADKHTATSDGRLSVTAANAMLVAGDMFASGSGFEDHTEETGDVASLRGTFDGAPGLYQCTQDASDACRSTVDGSGGIVLGKGTTAGGWTFKPDKGAMTSTPDAEYVIYGWWSREVAGGVDVATFAQRVGGTTDLSGQANVALTGTATYTGGAAGKYAINDPIGGNSDAGAFTAKAELTAKFDTSAEAGTVSGMLSDFMAGGEAKDWTVSLKGVGTNDGAPIRADGFGEDTATVDASESATVWTISGTAAAASGEWGGNFYYDTAAKQTAANTPETAAGTFMSEYGNVGRMVGAFGATKDE